MWGKRIVLESVDKGLKQMGGSSDDAAMWA